MKHLLKLSAAAIIATSATASAATYNVDGLINDSYDGFRSSLIHEQSYNGDMSLSYGEASYDFDETVGSGGTWNTDIVDDTVHNIGFYGSLEGGSVAYKASGHLNTDGGGFLNFVFGSMYGPARFTFDGSLGMGPANSFANGIISLWGETGDCGHAEGSCLGTDLRIAVSPSEVPLPASALLLLGGLGGFAAMRRKKS